MSEYIYYNNSDIADIEATLEVLHKEIAFGVEIETNLDDSNMFEYDCICYDEYGEEVDECDEYYYHCEEDEYPLPLAVDIADALNTWTDRIYYDGSCGMEIPTGTFTNPAKFRDALLKARKIFKEYEFNWEIILSPTSGAGGHFNISYTGWNDYTGAYGDDHTKHKVMAIAIRPFIPVITYLFQHYYTNERDEDYRYMNDIAEYDADDISEKYHWLHEKSYALELRFPDSPAYINRSTALYYTLIGLILTAETDKVNPLAIRQLDDDDFSELIQETYYATISSGYLSERHIDYIREAFQYMLDYLDEYMEMLYALYGIDLRAMLEYTFWYDAGFDNDNDIPDDVFEYYIPVEDMKIVGVMF